MAYLFQSRFRKYQSETSREAASCPHRQQRWQRDAFTSSPALTLRFPDSRVCAAFRNQRVRLTTSVCSCGGAEAAGAPRLRERPGCGSAQAAGTPQSHAGRTSTPAAWGLITR